MRAPLCVLLVAACALASEPSVDEERGSKLPYVADAVGNELPPPSSLPATVGSPVNLITPDRYEFYTFDESGELVKRLMTLEEIQAIVAAGEESEGLVTFANDNQPTIAFNFSQPPFNKVHNVVTNVQNVLKAQMEAHKNKPHFQPTLDTPDVSDSWSLILPSIFGNTGVDIGPDKIQNVGTFTTPETETIEVDHINNINENSLSKEGNNHILSSSTTIAEEELKTVPVTEKVFLIETETKKEPTTITTTTTITTPKPTTTKLTTTSTPTVTRLPTTKSKLTTTSGPTTTTTRSTTTTARPLTITPQLTTSTSTRASTTSRTPIVTKTPLTTRVQSTTKVPSTTKIPTTIKTKPTSETTTKKVITTTRSKPTTTTTTTIRPKITTTTAKPIVSTTTTKPTTKTVVKTTTTVKPTRTTQKISEEFVTSNLVNSESSTTETSSTQYMKISTFDPISTSVYVTEKSTSKQTDSLPEDMSVSTTRRSISTTDIPTTSGNKLFSQFIYSTPSNFIYILPSTQKPDNEIENNKINSTTITTQSVSPSTTVSSTEFLTSEKVFLQTHVSETPVFTEDESAPIIPLFDVAQSISQIASDLGSSYKPIPTSSNLLDTTKISSIDLESKENFELDIPNDSTNLTDIKSSNVTENDNDNFVKISTLDPHAPNIKKESEASTVENKDIKEKDKEIIKDSEKDKIELSTVAALERTTMDPFLSESMGDLLSQVVHENPQTIATSGGSSTEGIKVTTIETEKETTITDAPIVTTTDAILQTSEKEVIAPTTLEKKHDENKSHLKIEEIDKTAIVTMDYSTDKNQGYVQISNSKDPNNTFVLSSPVTLSSKDDNDEYKSQNEKLTTATVTLGENQTQKSAIKTSTSSVPNVNFITKPSTLAQIETTTIAQYIKNKFDSADNINKLTKDKVKLPEFQPKIDDFKKKIQKVNIDDKELAAERNNSWKLIPTVIPTKTNNISNEKVKEHYSAENNAHKDLVLDFSKENQGLEVTTKDLEQDIAQFTELCNELAFRYWNAIVENIDKRRSFVLSPYSITSMLAMMFMGARGATSGEMNEILKLDDMVTFNPHFTLKNISDSIETSPEAGISVSAFIRELYSDKSKGKILRFYKERAQQFYNGHVEEIDFKLIGDKIRRRTNLLVKRYTWGKMSEYIKTSTINMQPPLAAFSANIFETDCSGSSVEGRDGEMYFVVSPNVRQRRLVPVPAVVYRSSFLAGYDPVLDATAAALGNANSIISTLFLMPGQQGNVVHSEDLETLEKRLLDANPSTPAWNRLLRTLLPRIGLELQIPRFSHKSVFNVSSTLRKMGLKDLFDQEHADLGGLIGPSKDLYLSDMIQSTTFVTCGEGLVADQHHVEEYPETLESPARRRSSRWAHDWEEPRDYQRAFHDPHDVGDAMHLPLHLRPRQARLPSRNAQPARLKFDRPFLYFVRHNPSGMILYVGRYNPRLLP